MPKVIISDETSLGNILNELELEFDKERITLKDLIAARVSKEVDDYTKDLKANKGWLVPITEEERILNGHNAHKDIQSIDAETQIYIALEGFQKNAFFVIVEDKQIEELEEEILIGDSTSVSFIRLIPLVGG